MGRAPTVIGQVDRPKAKEMCLIIHSRPWSALVSEGRVLLKRLFEGDSNCPLLYLQALSMRALGQGSLHGGQMLNLRADDAAIGP